MATIQGIYIALFGRPADPIGLEYFNGVTNNGADLTAISDLSGQPEYLNRFEGMTNLQIVNSIYQSLFGRDADLVGLTFFVNQLQTGAQSINTIAINIYDGAQGTDLTILQNKEAWANAFTASIDTGEELLAYQGEAAAQAGRDFLANVGIGDTEVDQAAVDAALAAIVDAGIPGEIFTLTAGQDIFTGTANNDLFQGTVDSLNAFDRLEGGAGTDELRLFGDASTISALGATVNNIEIINLQQAGIVAGGTVNAAVFGATAQQIWQIDVANDIENVGAATAGFRNTADTAVTVGFTGSSGSVALDNVTGNTALTLDGAAAVSISGSAGNSLTLFGDTEDLTLALTAATPLDVSALADLETVNASGSAGAIEATFDLAVLTELESVVLGSGADNVVTGGFSGQDIAFSLGGGNDLIKVFLNGSESNVVLTGGAGDDSFVFEGGNVQITGGEFDGSVTITDFDAASDVLSLDGFAGFTAQNLVETAIAGATTLFEAVTAIGALDDAIVGVELYSRFVFEGDTYVYADVGADGLNDGDVLIALSGQVSLNSDNVVGLIA